MSLPRGLEVEDPSIALIWRFPYQWTASYSTVIQVEVKPRYDLSESAIKNVCHDVA
jgi:hypothetical protein